MIKILIPVPLQNAPYGQADKGSSPALLISIMEQPFYSINALVLTLSRFAEKHILK